MTTKPFTLGTVPIESSVRSRNLARILALLRDEGPRSRARIATDLGVPKATITALTADLLARGLVADADETVRGPIGRPSRLVRLDGAGLLGIGVEVNPDYLAVQIHDLGGAVRHHHRVPISLRSHSAAEVLELTARELDAVLVRARAEGGTVVGVCVAVPGGVDPATGILGFSARLGWRDVAVADGIRSRSIELGAVPLEIENDARMAAVAEYIELASLADPALLTAGAGVLTGGAGVAFALISAGGLVAERPNAGREIGHTPIGPRDRECPCGRRGCWELAVSLDALLENATAHGLALGDDDVDVDVEVRLDALLAAAADGDVRTAEVFDEWAESVSTGVCVLVDVLDVPVIVFGGHFARLGPHLLPRVEGALAGRRFSSGGAPPRLLASAFGSAAAVHGAAQHAFRRVFETPESVPRTDAR